VPFGHARPTATHKRAYLGPAVVYFIPCLNRPASVTKAQIVDRIAAATGLTKLETEAVVDGFMYTVIEAVVTGQTVELRGFGTFRVRERAARTARNPHTDALIVVPPQEVPVFKPAAEFRRLVRARRKDATNDGPAG